jgi:hypothetical protein
MAKQSQAWKNLERQVAKALGGKRVLRGANFSVEDVDVKLEDIPFIRIDAKYRKKHAHHTLMAEIKTKYCQEDGQIPVLVTKHHNQDGAYVTVDLEFFAILLMAFRKNLKLEPSQ